jgi:hypothetical protein
MVLEKNAGDPQKRDDLLDRFLLDLQIVRHLVAVLLVVGLKLRPPLGQTGIPDHRGIIGPEILQHPPKGLHESVDCIRRLTLGIRQSPDREEGSVKIVMPVYKKQAG